MHPSRRVGVFANSSERSIAWRYGICPTGLPRRLDSSTISILVMRRAKACAGTAWRLISVWPSTRARLGQKRPHGIQRADLRLAPVDHHCIDDRLTSAAPYDPLHRVPRGSYLVANTQIACSGSYFVGQDYVLRAPAGQVKLAGSRLWARQKIPW